MQINIPTDKLSELGTPVVRRVSLLGNIKALQHVEIRARVEGCLETMHFEEGGYVNKNDLLFVIDRQLYKARLRFEGGLTSEIPYQQAQVELAKTASMVPDLQLKIKMKENDISFLKASSRKYVELALFQHLNGHINYLDVLDAQRSYFNAEIQHSNAIRDRYLAMIDLYKALGGGWK